MIRVTVWNEYLHEKLEDAVREIYPNGIHGCIADFLGKDSEISVRTTTLNEPSHGLTDDVLNDTDVLIWWAHMAHDEVSDEIAAKVANRVLCGMGFIVLHSGHLSKPFIKLMGTSCTLRWRDGDFERLWTVMPGHPIAIGIEDYIELEHEEMYGEMFDIPQPDELVFLGWFRGGEVFRAGCCFYRGIGKVFYFQPGHEFYPTYHDPGIQKIIYNSVRWAYPNKSVDELSCPWIEHSPESIRSNRIAEGKT